MDGSARGGTAPARARRRRPGPGRRQAHPQRLRGGRVQRREADRSRAPRAGPAAGNHHQPLRVLQPHPARRRAPGGGLPHRLPERYPRHPARAGPAAQHRPRAEAPGDGDRRGQGGAARSDPAGEPHERGAGAGAADQERPRPHGRGGRAQDPAAAARRAVRRRGHERPLRARRQPRPEPDPPRRRPGLQRLPPLRVLLGLQRQRRQERAAHQGRLPGPLRRPSLVGAGDRHEGRQHEGVRGRGLGGAHRLAAHRAGAAAQGPHLLHPLGAAHLHRPADPPLRPPRREGGLPLLRRQRQGQPHLLAPQPRLPELVRRRRPLLERVRGRVRQRQVPRGERHRRQLRMGQRHLHPALELPVRQPPVRQPHRHLQPLPAHDQSRRPLHGDHRRTAGVGDPAAALPVRHPRLGPEARPGLHPRPRPLHPRRGERHPAHLSARGGADQVRSSSTAPPRTRP